jgi:hypothetical protein
MPLHNRVLPDGSIVAIADRGTMMGNRGGCFHRDDKTLLPRRWASRQWICCVLDFKGRRRRLMQPGLYTELFFLDEATALAAGHRPCFECRRAEAIEFAGLWRRARGKTGRAAAAEMDALLHAERLDAKGGKRTHWASLASLPRGAMFRDGEAAYLIADARLLAWSPGGYSPAGAARAREVEVLTPPAFVAVLAAGYRPRLHDSAQELH